MWSIQIRWADAWVTVQSGFKSRDDAEWATAKWKQANDCTGDPFRAVDANEGDTMSAYDPAEVDDAVVPLDVPPSSMPATDEIALTVTCDGCKADVLVASARGGLCADCFAVADKIAF